MKGRKDALWFSFKGVRSDAMGVHVRVLPDIPVAEERGEEVEIPGRDGVLWVSDDSLKEVELTAVIDVESAASLNSIAAWLSGYGELVLSSLSSYCYHARISSGFTFEQGVYAYGRHRAEVTFIANPYKFEIGNPALPDMHAPTEVAGQGTVYSRPIITIYGNGDVNLAVNDCELLIEDMVDYITIDCDAMMAYKDDENWSPQITLFSMGDVDEWPSLRPEGQNNWIDWYDETPGQGSTEDVEVVTRNNVTKVVVQPNWRWR